MVCVRVCVCGVCVCVCGVGVYGHKSLTYHGLFFLNASILKQEAFKHSLHINAYRCTFLLLPH